MSTPTILRLPLSNVQKYAFVHSLFFFLLCVLFLHLCFFVRLLSCAAFSGASAFNADISQWQTGAVTNMYSSEYTNHVWLPLSNVHQCFCPLTLLLLAVCSLSPPLFFVRLFSCVAFAQAWGFNADLSKWQTGAVTTLKSSEYTNHAVVTFVEFSSVFFSHSFFFFLLCVLFLHLCFFVRLLSCVAFEYASAFNADLSQWQTGAVTTMYESEYTNHVWLPLSNVHQCSYVTHSFLLLAVCSLSPPLFFVRLLSCVAFSFAYAFNADLSKWQTGAVTSMFGSEYTNHVW